MYYQFDCDIRTLKSKISDSASGNPFKVGYFRVIFGRFFYVNYITDPLGDDFGCLPMIGFIGTKNGKAYVRAKRNFLPMLPSVALCYGAMCLICYLLMARPVDVSMMLIWAAVGTAAAIALSVARNYVYSLFDVGFEADKWLYDFWENMGGTDGGQDDAAAQDFADARK